MKLVRVVPLLTLVFGLSAKPALADITGFIGANTTPANRQVRGAAAGIGLLIVAFEFEFANTTDDPLASAPSLTTGSGNILFQTPVAFFGFQPYFTTGAGLYRETLGDRAVATPPFHRDTGIALNTGGGVKVSLIGPVRLRVDYRVFKLGSGALNSPAHRLYAGLNLKF
jgi:hypothetical protein